jgi:hypothetical protein
MLWEPVKRIRFTQTNCYENSGSAFFAKLFSYKTFSSITSLQIFSLSELLGV